MSMKNCAGLALAGQVPKTFASLHPRFHTPHRAILLVGGQGFRGWGGRFAPSLAASPLPESNRVLILNHTRREKQKAP